MKPVHEGFHAHDARRLRGSGHRVALRSGDAERFLAQHVLAGFRKADGPLRVHTVRQRNVDRVDTLVLEQRLVAAVRVGNPVGLGELPRPIVLPASDGENNAARGLVYRRDDRRTADVGRADDSPPQGAHSTPAVARCVSVILRLPPLGCHEPGVVIEGQDIVATEEGLERTVDQDGRDEHGRRVGPQRIIVDCEARDTWLQSCP